MFIRERCMHWCDSIEFELVGTDSNNDRYDKYRDASLQDLRLQAGECKFCADAADMINYRLRHDSTWSRKYGIYNSGDPVRPTEDDIMAAKVSISIHHWRETRNWSFGFDGVSYRNLLTIYVICGRQQIEIALQRFNAGGRVPVTIKSDQEYGDFTVTYTSPGSWRERKPGDIGPHGGAWKDREKETIASLEPTFGRLRPLVVNFDTIKAWVRICEREHDICRHQGDALSISKIRLIDVKNMCVKEFSGQAKPQFATLSYVWGTRPFLRLTTDVLPAFLQIGSLRANNLPLTISDAIIVCENLGIDYIWVDSFCILQDDDFDKTQIIDKMESIYHESVLTIVAATGTDAHSGIPGVRPNTRFLEQRVLSVRGMQLVDSVDHNQFRMQTGYQEPEWISSTPWARRAWTFQEALVSRRTLFFTSEQVYWSCREGLLSEDTTEHFALKKDEYGRRTRLDDEFSPLEYKNIAITFSTRKLTFEADIGRAYLGTQNYLNKKWGGHRFSWGLPHGAFGSLLMWEWAFMTDRRPREGTHPMRLTNGSIAHVPFPTWSWMGWTEGQQLIAFFGDEPDAHSPSFFVFDSANTLLAVEDGLHWSSRPKPLVDLLTADRNSTDDNIKFETEVTEYDIPPELHANLSLRQSALIFYTETVKVKYNSLSGLKPKGPYDTPSNLKMISQKYPFSIKIGSKFYEIVETDQNDTNDKQLEEIELVAVFSGQMTKPKKLRGRYRLYCWPVFRQGGLRVRASYMATVIFLELWNILPQRNWEIVTMV
ncbi:heterokaryon incompatibility domain-containing protein [Trichoderma sp. SZMC 28014]